MRDYDIRVALRHRLITDHSDTPGTRVIDEVGLCLGKVRIDMLVVNSTLSGYEIKSDLDTLERLPSQEEVYNEVFDEVNVITGSRHADKVIGRIPEWWGIWQATQGDDDIVRFEILRLPKSNPDIKVTSLVQCLWRDEALAALRDRHIERGVLTKPRALIWKKLVENLTTDELKGLVCQCLKARNNWRLGQLQRTNGD